MTDEIECPDCEGEGWVEHPHRRNHTSIVAESPPDPVKVDCETCASISRNRRYVPADHRGRLYRHIRQPGIILGPGSRRNFHSRIRAGRILQ